MTIFPFFIIQLMNLLAIGRSAPHVLRIGAIFHGDEGAHHMAFERALAVLQHEQIAPSYYLQSRIMWVNASTDGFSTYTATCKLVEEGVVAIFGPGNPSTSSIVSSVTTRYNIPHIEYIFRRLDDIEQSPTTINIYPDTQKIADALSDLLDAMNWIQFTVLYETNDGLSRLQKVLMKHGPKDFPVTVRQLQPTFDKITKEPDYRPVLKEIANSTDFNVILDMEPENARTIMKQAHEVKLMQDYYNYIITSLHSPTEFMVEVLNKSRANVTAIQLLDDASMDYHLETVESAVIFDAVFLLNDAFEILKKLDESHGHRHLKVHTQPLSCGGTEKFAIGENITSLMREISTVGRMTGPMKFMEDGGRSFKLTFKEYQKESVFTSGYWENGELTVLRTEKERAKQALQSIEQTEFRVTTRLGEPYVIELPEDSQRGVLMKNNKRYEGYAIDLIHAISEELKFKYTFELVPDGEYGTYNKDTKQWNGLIGQLLNREADLAICDLTITKARESAVDFTMPFMNLGISILFAKPENKEPELFSFLSPFSTDVWIYMATAYVAVSVLLFVQARIAPEEWDAAHPCNTEPEELENNFDLMNSLWLTAGSLVQQGSDILPRAPSIRMVAGMWWFFVLIMVSSYTANLAAFLTATKMDVSINNVDELAAQTKIKYGAIKDGSTASYFKGSNVSTYQRMWATMSEAKPSVFTKKNDEGVERVAKSKRTYAFLMESTGIEYAIERNCNLMPVGTLLDNKGYGIAMPPNSPYRTEFSAAILKLQEKGILRELKDKWWLKDSKNCSANEPEPSSGELTMAHVGGVFLVLIFGLTLGVIFAIIECFWNVRRVAVEEKITPLEAFVAEAKFALNVTAQTKPVKISKSSKTSSGDSAGEFVKEVSTERSIVGSFLRLDIIGKMDKNKDSNVDNRE